MALQGTIIQQSTELTDEKIFPRADFDVNSFDALIYQKGRRALIESALLCPCKSKSSAAQSTCKNCGGTGWVFVNRRESRIVMQGFDAATKLAGWSEELRGMARISCISSERLSYMDRLTALDGEEIYNEVVFIKKKGSTLFAYTAYDIKKLEYVGWFKGTDHKFQQLTEGLDFTYSKNAIRFNSTVFGSAIDQSITLRYIHAPAFHIVEFKRATMESFRLDDSKGEILQHMPLSAYARRAHYLLTAPNLAGDRLLDNSYSIDSCGCSTTPTNVLLNDDGTALLNDDGTPLING